MWTSLLVGLPSSRVTPGVERCFCCFDCSPVHRRPVAHVRCTRCTKFRRLAPKTPTGLGVAECRVYLPVKIYRRVWQSRSTKSCRLHSSWLSYQSVLRCESGRRSIGECDSHEAQRAAGCTLAGCHIKVCSVANPERSGFFSRVDLEN